MPMTELHHLGSRCGWGAFGGSPEVLEAQRANHILIVMSSSDRWELHGIADKYLTILDDLDVL